MSGTANLRQIHYRIRTDTGTTVESVPTWGAAEDTNFFVGFDTNFRVRISVENTGTANGSVGAWAYSRCGGTQVAITTATAFTQTENASSDVDNADCTTQRLTSGAGTYQGGKYTEDGTATLSIVSGQFAEFEAGVAVLSADCGGGERIEYRSNTTLNTIVVPAYVTTSEQTGSDFQPGNRLGGAGSNTSGTTLVITTSAVAAAANLVVLCIALDNTSAADGATSEVTSIADSAGGNTWLKAVEFCNSQTGAGLGATVSIWYSTLTNQINSSGTITATLANSILSKAMTARCYTVAGGKTVEIEATNSVATDATSTSPTALDATTSNIECLRVCASAIEGGGTVMTAATVKSTTGGLWSLFRATVGAANCLVDTSSTSADSASHMSLLAEATISTATGASSQVRCGAVSRDWATAYVAFRADTTAAADDLFAQAIM